MNKNILIVLLLLAVFVAPSYALTVTGTGCKGNDVCETTTTCDISGNCNTEYANCKPCGVTVQTCPDGSVATAQNVCRAALGAGECRPGIPVCVPNQNAEATKVLQFEVFTKKGFKVNITPSEITAIAGTTVDYEVSVENQNPIPLSLNIGRETPPGWSSESVVTLDLGPRSKNKFTLSVTSNDTTSDGVYAISMVFLSPGLDIVGTATASYKVASRGAPSVSISPKTQQAVPGQEVMFTVTVTSNDPSGFDAAPFALEAFAPEGWSTSLNDTVLRIAPGASASTVMFVTSPDNGSAGDSATITVNASTGSLSAEATAEVTLNLCGNGICEENEACEADCPAEQFFTCNFGSRCEQQVDDGVEYSATPNFVYNKFVICSRASTEDECLAGFDKKDCGYGKACICGSNLGTDCKLVCVDKKDAYYIFATGVPSAVRSAANYSYTCPYVNLPEIIQTRNSFSSALDNYQKAKSALDESINTAKTPQEKSRLQPCSDALGLISNLVQNHLDLLDKVIAWPGITNTTASRERTAELRGEIEALFNNNCRGASGLVQIYRIITPGGVEKGEKAVSTVEVKNIGDTTYFGTLACDYISPTGQKSCTSDNCNSYKSTCTKFLPGVVQSFTPVANITEAGTWKLQCTVKGSLSANCDPDSIHDINEAQFNVSTKEVYVVDVSGACSADGVLCDVRASSESACTSCYLGNVSCQKISQSGSVSTFKCIGSQLGYNEIKGSVFPTSQCIPVDPLEKTASVLCEGCGDNIVNGNEQCELPGSDNSQYCRQNATVCVGKRFGQRDAKGFCTPTCSCNEDLFDFTCQKNKCGATCNDGDTKNITITSSAGSCVCVQQCGATCEFQPCSCEPKVCGNNICEVGETAASCPKDCGAINQCGNNICNVGENSTSCPQDCNLNNNPPLLSTLSAYVTTTNSIVFTTSASDPDGDSIQLQCGTVLSGTDFFTTQFVTSNPSYIVGSPWTNNSGHTIFCRVKDSRGLYSQEKSVTLADGTSSCGNGICESGETSSSCSSDCTGNNVNGTCSVSIASKNCTFVSSTNRYQVQAHILWQGGDHAHISVDGDVSQKKYLSPFDSVNTLSGPGYKQLLAEVHNSTDGLRCNAATQIYCAAGGSTSGKLVDVVRNFPNTARVGGQNMQINIIPYADVQSFELKENVDSALLVRNIVFSGNTSPVVITQTTTVDGSKTYNTYTFTTDLMQNKNMTIFYFLTFPAEGTYTVYWAYNAFGQTATEQPKRVISVTDCPQTFPVYAVSPSGECRQFANSCKQPKDWVFVDKCPDVNRPPAEPVVEHTDNTLLIVLIIVLVIILIILIKYRDEIKRKLGHEEKENIQNVEFEQ